MIALHKPQRATYGQAVEAQVEFKRVDCTTEPLVVVCAGLGFFQCCV